MGYKLQFHNLQGIMAFSLGLTIAQTHLKMRIKILAIAIFSIASPIGIAIGIGVTDMQEVSQKKSSYI